MSYDQAFNRLNQQLNDMVNEALSSYIGQNNNKNTIAAIKSHVEDAYRRFYEGTTMAEREFLELVNPIWLEANVEVVDHHVVNVSMRRKS